LPIFSTRDSLIFRVEGGTRDHKVKVANVLFDGGNPRVIRHRFCHAS
jgi:hypothetical protein